jgi:serine O-acetyltransferase
VLKEVPAGATAVGIPARILQRGADAQREAAANRMGFSAYGLSSNGDDPLIKALHGLIDHAAAQQRMIDKLVAALQRQGIAVDDVKADAPAVDPHQLDKLVDE